MRRCLAVPMLLVAAVGTASDDGRSWEYLENRDPLSKGGLVAIASFQDSSGAFAMVRCWSATRLLDVRLGFPDVDRLAPRSVGLAFDNGTPVTVRVLLSPNRRTVVVAPEYRVRVLDGLRRAHQVHIHTNGADDDAHDPVTMHLSGSARTIAQVEAHCVR